MIQAQAILNAVADRVTQWELNNTYPTAQTAKKAAAKLYTSCPGVKIKQYPNGWAVLFWNVKGRYTHD